MRVHFQREIDKLKRQILEMSADVEHAVSDAVLAVQKRDAGLARLVLEHETQTNVREVDVEEECLKILALHQPVAADLRYLVSVLKINHDLERIGDLAAHIAEGALLLVGMPSTTIPPQLGTMATKARHMLKQVLDAFIAMDASRARAVCEADRELDAIHADATAWIEATVFETPAHLHALLRLLHICRHLERIGDHATNIAEDVIYMIEGRIVRHAAPPTEGGQAAIGPPGRSSGVNG